MDPFAADDLVLSVALLQAVIALLVVRFFDLYEREPIGVVALLFLWGAIVAGLLASAGNTALEGALPHRVEVVFGDAISAPVIEETAKGLALLIVVLGSRWAHKRFGVFEFDGVTDGIVYGAAVGIGFAFSEDLFYFFREARNSGIGDALSVFVDRRDFFGPAMLRHGIWTATFGAGLGLATWSRTWRGRIGWPLLGLLAAMVMHAINNGLVPIWLAIKYGYETTFEYFTVGVPVNLADQMDATAVSATDALRWISWAYVIAFFAAIAAWLAYQRRVIRAELTSETESGLISADEAADAASFTRRSRREIASLRAGDLDAARSTSALCRTLAELAFTKGRLAGLDDEHGEVERRRDDVREVLAARAAD
jgi:RsiW-degrading membrane proteinase PrsW (M82 family)